MCIICGPGLFGLAGFGGPPAGPVRARFTATAEDDEPGRGFADVILCDGPILTMAEGSAEAIALRRGRILAIGPREGVLARRGRMTRVIRLDGRTALPGFIDPHWTAPAPTEALCGLAGRGSAAGLTGLGAVGLDAAGFLAVQAVLDETPRLRVRAFLAAGTRDGVEGAGLYPRVGDDMVRAEGIAFDLAAADAPGEPGAALGQAHRQGWQIAVRAPTARHVDAALDALAAALAAQPRPDHRHRVEHRDTLEDHQVARMRQLGVFPVPWRPATADQGPPEPLRFAGEAALGLLGADGEMTEAAAILAGLRAVTADAAWHCRMEDCVGRLGVGTQADLVLLDGDPRLVPADALARMRVDATWIAGREVYRA